MTEKYTLLQLFSLVDGRLSTSIDDVYDMLNHITDMELMTHHLPVAMEYIRIKKPMQYLTVLSKLNALKTMAMTNDFITMIDLISEKYSEEYDISQLKDEVDVSDFEEFMINNSILR